ncbi:signal peptidase I [Halomarina oriensis]|uniref:Signal peptidase I n=1 Tax=Halomarina oriensis TaxID=671145 RepID=A0A6B0GM00_9EURY|nr:signal peptidase I [Halomarina oriensis]MWG33165.1 signal peptidase I [Halomarina oriensis]
MYRRLAFLTAVLAVAAIAFGPLHLSYVTSGSMEPTLSPGDGYLVVEGPVSEGDVVTFHSEERGYVTHRIVSETDEGFITKGDANPSTDQAAGNPVVSESAIVGTVVTLGGGPLVIPMLGPLVGFVGTYELLVFGVVAALFAWGFVGNGGGTPIREVYTFDDLARPLFLGLVVASLLVMVFATSVHPARYAVEEGELTQRHSIPAGQEVEREVTVKTNHLPFTTTVADASGATVVERTVEGSTTTLTLHIPPQEVGTYEPSVRVSPYPAVLPGAWLDTLHGVSPYLARVVVLLVTFGPLFAAYSLFFDGGARMRSVTPRWVERARAKL